jgi:hypothetical protein
MEDPILADLLSGIKTRRGAKIFLQRALSLVVKHHGEPAARQMMTEVATPANKKKALAAFTMALYDAAPNADALARYLHAIGAKRTLTAADRYVDRLKRKRRGVTKKFWSGARATPASRLMLHAFTL